MKRQFKSYLNDILEEIIIIIEATNDITFEDFKNDKILIRAITRSFEIIGEAVIHIPNEIKEKYDNIKWRDIKDFRNVIIHKYWGTELEREWDIIKNELETLKLQIEEIINYFHNFKDMLCIYPSSLFQIEKSLQYPKLQGLKNYDVFLPIGDYGMNFKENLPKISEELDLYIN
jgi:uncharacterized protein with HEPN domain